MRKRKVKSTRPVPVQLPVSFQTVFVPIFQEITNPVKNDVFMGYQGPLDIEYCDVGVQSEMEIDNIDLDLFESEPFEFEKYKLTI
jgi:hypothetical protein